MRFLILFLCQIPLWANSVDLIVFSYDRPMQLYAFLESLYTHSIGIQQTSVIYLCSNDQFSDAYDEVFDTFPQVRAIEQYCVPQDFKFLVVQEAFGAGSAEYIAFAVDDMIATGEIDFQQCVQAMQMTHAYGFYLRLGKNIDDCYSSGSYEGIPSLVSLDDSIYLWEFKTGIGDWAYPHTLDMTIFRKKDIERRCREGNYFNPNSLEDQLGGDNLERMGLCYETSRVLNIPLNIVSQTSATLQLGVSSQFLLDQFNAGLKIDIFPFYHCGNRSTHCYEYPISFTNRRR